MVGARGMLAIVRAQSLAVLPCLVCSLVIWPSTCKTSPRDVSSELRLDGLPLGLRLFLVETYNPDIEMTR